MNNSINIASLFSVITAVVCPFLLYVSPLRGYSIYLAPIVLPLVIFCFVGSPIYRRSMVSLLMFTLLVVPWSLFSFIVRSDDRTILFSLSVVSHLAIALLLVNNRHLALASSKISLIFVIVWYILCLLIVGLTPEDANKYIQGLSRNHVSYILLVAAFFYYSVRVYYRVSYSLVPAILVLLASFQLYGRSGIFSAVLLAFFVFWHKVILNRKVSSGLGTGMVLGLFATGLSLVLVSGSDMLLGAYVKGLDSDRWRMLAEYVSAIDINTFIFGLDINVLPSVVDNDGNPHNSLIRGHSYFGLPFFMLLCSAFFLLVYKIMFYNCMGLAFISSILLLLFVRAFFDSLLFFGVYDYLFMYLFLLAFLSPGQRGIPSSIKSA